jgi:hypothetical protein
MFEFVMPSQPPRTCKVVWLGETRMGVHFQISAVPAGEEKL